MVVGRLEIEYFPQGDRVKKIARDDRPLAQITALEYERLLARLEALEAEVRELRSIAAIGAIPNADEETRRRSDP
jgi:hypothetical protein